MVADAEGQTQDRAQDRVEDQLTLRSQLSEIARVPVWVSGVASRHSISENVQFAVNLCLEEALSNVIRHGYAGEADRPLAVSFISPVAPRERYFEFIVEDTAPGFNLLVAPEIPALNPTEPIRLGGQGIRLLRQFADSIEYEQLATGNRLRLGFSDDVSAVEAK